jgi:hypothetical protein
MPGKRRKRVWLAVACAALLAVPLLYGRDPGHPAAGPVCQAENPAVPITLVYKQLAEP